MLSLKRRALFITFLMCLGFSLRLVLDITQSHNMAVLQFDHTPLKYR
jgi:hypothetical protein